jgi:hypothetical protein
MRFAPQQVDVERRAHRATILRSAEPPSIDRNGITDKGYINQRAVLTRRAAHVEELHAGGPRAIVP